MSDLRSTRIPSNTAESAVNLRWPASAIWRPGEPAVNTISISDLRDALAKGIDDFEAMPSHAFFICLIYPVLGLVLARLLLGYDMLHLVFPVTAGFTLIGPAAAIGLYELSRRREQGLDASVWHVFDVARSPSIGAIIRLSLMLALIFLAWLYAAQLIYTQIMGNTPPGSIGSFIRDVTTTDAGYRLVVVGNVVGFCFALLVLIISVVSFPMMVDRKTSAATAVRTSIRAVVENPLVIATWGIFVAGALLLGFLTFGLGLAVALPVLGHASWHLYRKIVSRDRFYSDDA